MMMRKAGLIFLFFCIFLLTAAPAAAADLFAHVPSDYFMVMHAPDFERVLLAGEKIAQTFKLPAAPGKQKGELDAMRQSGLDVAGEMALIMFDVPDKQAADPRFVILARVRDRALFDHVIVTDSDGSAAIRRAGAQPVYVQFAGDYAVMAIDKDSLRLYRQKLKGGVAAMKPEVKAAIAGNDATLVMNFKKAWPLVTERLNAQQAAPSPVIAVTPPQRDGAAAKQQTAMPELDPMAKLWLDETETVLIGYKSGETDVSLTLLMSVRPGGFAANVLSRYNENTTPGFAGLPGGKWAVAGLFADDRQEEEVYRNITGKDYQPVRLPKKKTPNMLTELISQGEKLEPLIGGGRYAWYVGAGEPADGLLQGVYIIETSDAAKLNTELVRAVKAVAAANRRDKELSWKIAEKTSEVNLSGMAATRIDLKFSARDKSRDAGKMLDFLRQVNGSETLSLYLLPYDRHTFLLGVGNAAPLVWLTATTLKTGISSLDDDPQLVEARHRLAGANLGMLAVSPGRIIDAAGRSGTMFETMLGRPVVFSAGASGETVILQVYVPHTLLKMLFPPQNYPLAPDNKRPAA